MGGIDEVTQMRLLAKRPHIIVGTPGRLLYMLQVRLVVRHLSLALRLFKVIENRPTVLQFRAGRGLGEPQVDLLNGIKMRARLVGTLVQALH